MNITFYKMQGCGNDFILIDNRILKLTIAQMSEFARKICKRSFGIGADGMILLDESSNKDTSYKWHFYNSDGSRGEMCGNGARCAAWLAYKLKMATKEHQFQTDAGIIKAFVYPHQNKVKVLLTQPKDLKINVTNYMNLKVHFVNTGVPHAVIIVDDVKSTDVDSIGREIRYHSAFAPQGTNVNFVQVIDPKHLYIRTYERGVENETFACGTGCAASAIITNALGLTEKKVELITSGKEILCVIIDENAIWLKGSINLVYKGQFHDENFK